MPDLHLASMEQIADELKTRNMSWLLTWTDHNEFNKSPDQGIVWGIDAGGNLVLQDSLRRFLNIWLDAVLKQRCAPGGT